MSMMKGLYNIFYKAVDKKQNEPKGVFSDVEVEVQKDVPYDEALSVCKVDVWRLCNRHIGRRRLEKHQRDDKRKDDNGDKRRRP